MNRLNPTFRTIRALFALSGNQCAFPGCEHPLINEKNEFIAQVCHIEGAAPGGQRYNTSHTDEDRRSIENLILLCYRHHIETNDTDEYTVEKFKKIKQEHGQQFAAGKFEIQDSVALEIAEDVEQYWKRIDAANKLHQDLEPLAFEVPTDLSFSEIVTEIEGSIEWFLSMAFEPISRDDEIIRDVDVFLESLGYDTKKFREAPYYKNPLNNRNWEVLNIRVPNQIENIKDKVVDPRTEVSR